MTLRKRPFENIVEKGENAPFPTMFLYPSQNKFQFLSSAKASNLSQSKILSFGKELNDMEWVCVGKWTPQLWYAVTFEHDLMHIYEVKISFVQEMIYL